jgi:hypothetical protein
MDPHRSDQESEAAQQNARHAGYGWRRPSGPLVASVLFRFVRSVLCGHTATPADQPEGIWLEPSVIGPFGEKRNDVRQGPVFLTKPDQSNMQIGVDA